MAEPTCFLPYGSYVTSCGRIEDHRFPHRFSDERRKTTCGDCQAQMTDHGDLPEAIHMHDDDPDHEPLNASADYCTGCCLPWIAIAALALLFVIAIGIGGWLL